MRRFSKALRIGCAASVVAATAMAGGALAADTETILHNFAPATGMYPKAGPALDASTGALYGTTSTNGTNKTGNGVIYQLSPPTATNPKWTYTVIYTNPASIPPFLLAANGIVYGYNISGTGQSGNFNGTVVALTPPQSGSGAWTQTILYAFTGGSDGSTPEGPLAMDSQGALYGTAHNAGGGCSPNGCGTVFKLAPPSAKGQPWNFSVLYHFTGGAGGSNAGDGVIFDKQGNLYGSTGFDYPSYKSLIFKLTPPTGGGEWSESVLYRFYPTSSCYSANNPLAVDDAGALYGVFGTYSSNCTTVNEYVYQLKPSPSNPKVWVKTVMYSFNHDRPSQGYDLAAQFWPAPLTVDPSGDVYGTTLNGGTTYAGGTVFTLKPKPGVAGKWNYTALLDFATDVTDHNANATGALPNGGLALDANGVLYGTTYQGGSGGKGAVFSLTP
jgi:uncharacterized repeat protein (TIGR03803 family)